ncbi:MAG: amidohydrolase family protein [Alphaproteobacteria bacterium]|nr:amidohydrolase family protein [Alphaproteobacteria bacterium]
MKIDAHVHFWRLARSVNTALTPDMHAIYRDCEPEELTPVLDAAGVDGVVAVQASETLGENLFMAGLAERFDWIVGIVGWLDPGSPALAEEIAALSGIPKMKGVRPVRDDNHTIAWFLDRDLEPGWRMLAHSGLAVDLLVQDWRELPLAAELASRYPEGRFILDHVGKPDIAGGAFQDWACMIGDVAALPNVYCKFSGMMGCAGAEATVETLRPWFDHVVDRFGPQRVLWASDWPPLLLTSDYAKWASLSDALVSARDDLEPAAIFGGTAARVYSL